MTANPYGITTALDDNPETTSFLQKDNFRFMIKRAPNINWFVQKVNIPSFAMPTWEYPTPFLNLQTPGDHLNFKPLVIEFKVDENCTNYLELAMWLMDLSNLDSTRYKILKDKDPITLEGLSSEIQLIVLDSAKKANFEVIYHNCFPVYMGQIDLDTTITDIEYVTCQCAFNYDNFEINKVL